MPWSSTMFNHPLSATSMNESLAILRKYYHTPSSRLPKRHVQNPQEEMIFVIRTIDFLKLKHQLPNILRTCTFQLTQDLAFTEVRIRSVSSRSV